MRQATSDEELSRIDAAEEGPRMTTTKTTVTAITRRRDGALLWRRTERGGRETWYAPRRAGQTAPSSWPTTRRAGEAR